MGGGGVVDANCYCKVGGGGGVDANCYCKGGGVCWIQVRLTKSNLGDRGSWRKCRMGYARGGVKKIPWRDNWGNKQGRGILRMTILLVSEKRGGGGGLRLRTCEERGWIIWDGGGRSYKNLWGGSVEIYISFTGVIYWMEQPIVVHKL